MCRFIFSYIEMTIYNTMVRKKEAKFRQSLMNVRVMIRINELPSSQIKKLHKLFLIRASDLSISKINC